MSVKEIIDNSTLEKISQIGSSPTPVTQQATEQVTGCAIWPGSGRRRGEMSDNGMVYIFIGFLLCGTGLGLTIIGVYTILKAYVQ